jgi:hypothetical protein
MITTMLDKGDRRSFADRRHFSYAFHIPERRNTDRRRSSVDGRDQKKK